MSKIIETDDTLFHSAFTYAAIGMAIVAPNGSWLKINNAMCNIIGYSQQELMSKTFQDITHPDDLVDDLRFVNKLLAGEIDSYQMEKRYIHREGNIVHVLLIVSLVKNEDGTPRYFISQIQDITRQKEMEFELGRLAREDELTKVFNRRYFMEFSTREVVRGKRFHESQALLMIDIDHFKKINDTYGHDVGDEVLRAVSKTCSDSLRRVDVFGRLGGEEFGALILNVDSEIANMLAERMRRNVESLQVVTSSGTIQATVSIGMVLFSEAEMSLEALLKKADEALYEAKNSGRNKVVANALIGPLGSVFSESVPTSFVRLEWRKDYESGCETIDRQHQDLFHLANDLLSAIVSGQPDDHVESVVQDLIKYMVFHFRAEDSIFRNAGYPDADAHSREHNTLIQDMRTFLEEFRKGRGSVAELFDIVAIRTVRDHILTQDRKFFPYLDTSEPC